MRLLERINFQAIDKMYLYALYYVNIAVFTNNS